jgi:hypothetical protein
VCCFFNVFQWSSLSLSLSLSLLNINAIFQMSIPSSLTMLDDDEIVRRAVLGHSQSVNAHSSGLGREGQTAFTVSGAAYVTENLAQSCPEWGDEWTVSEHCDPMPFVKAPTPSHALAGLMPRVVDDPLTPTWNGSAHASQTANARMVPMTTVRLRRRRASDDSGSEERTKCIVNVPTLCPLTGKPTLELLPADGNAGSGGQTNLGFWVDACAGRCMGNAIAFFGVVDTNDQNAGSSNATYTFQSKSEGEAIYKRGDEGFVIVAPDSCIEINALLKAFTEDNDDIWIDPQAAIVAADTKTCPDGCVQVDCQSVVSDLETRTRLGGSCFFIEYCGYDTTWALSVFHSGGTVRMDFCYPSSPVPLL